MKLNLENIAIGFMIISIFLGMIATMFMSCTAMVEKPHDYPNEFIVHEKTNDSAYVYYFMDNYYIYHKRDFANENDTLYLKGSIFNKYLIIKK